jgi:hypothetical protein
MNNKGPLKDKNKHLYTINEKFDELEMLVYEYLQYSKNWGWDFRIFA